MGGQTNFLVSEEIPLVIQPYPPSSLPPNMGNPVLSKIHITILKMASINTCYKKIVTLLPYS